MEERYQAFVDANGEEELVKNSSMSPQMGHGSPVVVAMPMLGGDKKIRI